MDEYVFLNRILSPRYKSKKQDILDEPGVQTTQITNGVGVNQYSLYKFDTQGHNDMFPFFESQNSVVPASVRAFCDYVLLAEVLGKLHILLIEMKSGGASHAHKQLDASECFISYIRQTALRIKDENGMSDFSNDNITVKKIVLKPGKSLKPLTKVSQKSSDIKYVVDQDHYNYITNVFDIAHVCRVKI